MISITQITIIMLKSKNYTFYWQSIPCHQTHFISVCMYFLNKYLTFNIGLHKEIISVWDLAFIFLLPLLSIQQYFKQYPHHRFVWYGVAS